MKKLILIVFTSMICTSLSAQGLDFGIKAGANFTSLSDATGFSDKTGFVFGVFAGAKFGESVGIQADLLYSQQGATFNRKDIDLNYLNIPVVLKYYLTESINVQGGPQFGFVVNDNYKEITNNLKEAESFDLMGVVGIGLELPLGIRASGRYHFGLTEIDKENNRKNSVITLALGYSFL